MAVAAAAAVGASADSLFVVQQALAESTRRNYAAPLRAYTNFCAQRGLDPAPRAITVHGAGDWLSELALGGRVSSGTLKVYRSALSTAWEEAGVQGPNPLQDAWIGRMMAGSQRMLRARDVSARAERERTIELTPQLLGQLHASVSEHLRQGLRVGNPAPIVCWTAACLGVFGLLRPSEFLADGYQRFESPLRACDVTFYALPDHPGEMGLHALDSAAQNIPDRFSIRLGPTKADQLARNAPLTIAAPMAVAAMWSWMSLRARWGFEASGPLFNLEKRMVLSRPQLYKQLTEWLTPTLGYVPKLTGRCFRRGGASHLVESGASAAAIMAAGRWKSKAMINVYASAAAKQARATLDSRAMEPPAAAAAGSAAGAGQR